eukprot:m.1076469 g.1076469  ORF g.1076469 m.1076469 type:complete len:56 (+) comp24247_c0_seq37:1747-1914(+)
MRPTFREQMANTDNNVPWTKATCSHTHFTQGRPGGGRRCTVGITLRRTQRCQWMT